MIDIFNQIYTEISDRLRNRNSKVKTASVYVNVPQNYPFVSIVEIDNSIAEQYEDCCETENCVNISIEINAYAQGNDKMSVAKSLIETANDYLVEKGFSRNSLVPIQDQNETTYRFVARYDAVVSKDNCIYRR